MCYSNSCKSAGKEKRGITGQPRKTLFRALSQWKKTVSDVSGILKVCQLRKEAEKKLRVKEISPACLNTFKKVDMEEPEDKSQLLHSSLWDLFIKHSLIIFFAHVYLVTQGIYTRQ